MTVEKEWMENVKRMDKIRNAEVIRNDEGK